MIANIIPFFSCPAKYKIPLHFTIVYATIQKRITPKFICLASVAQSVEQLIRNEQVVGSNPTRSSKKNAVVMMSTVFWFEPTRTLANRRCEFYSANFIMTSDNAAVTF